MEMEGGNAATAGTGDEFMNLHICKRKRETDETPLYSNNPTPGSEISPTP
jgi:hypothetical protein